MHAEEVIMIRTLIEPRLATTITKSYVLRFYKTISTDLWPNKPKILYLDINRTIL